MQPTTTKNTTSTSGDTQMIGGETWISAPQLFQFKCWKRSRPQPSTRPAMMPNQIEIRRAALTGWASPRDADFRVDSDSSSDRVSVGFSLDLFYRNARELSPECYRKLLLELRGRAREHNFS